MQLLVSVRDTVEVEAALEGGADIIDAKDPAGGALAPVTPQSLRAIDVCLPDEAPLSVALGDAASPAEVAASITTLPLRRRAATVYLKLGIPATATAELGRLLLRTAVEAAGKHPASPRLIAVEYADSGPRGRHPNCVIEAAIAAGAAGLLVDTLTKDGRSLLAWWPESRLRGWIEDARAGGLLVAVAGSLGLAELSRVARLGPDIVGVRGAACLGGRAGAIQADRVRLLHSAVAGDPHSRREAPEPLGRRGRVVHS